MEKHEKTNNIVQINKEKGKVYTKYQIMIQDVLNETFQADLGSEAEALSGYVTVTFLVKSDGRVMEVKTDRSRTYANQHFIDRCLEITSKTRLPPFTSDMTVPMATYNITINLKYSD